MFLNIHFFRDNLEGQVDYVKLMSYFDEQPEKYKSYQTKDYVEFQRYDEAFKFTYRYLITNKSRVPRMWSLDPRYTSASFVLELPIMISEFLAKEVLAEVLEIVKQFNFHIYCEEFKDVQKFDSAAMLALFTKLRGEYIAQNGYEDKITYPEDKLAVICRYQRSISAIHDYFNGDVRTDYIVPLVDVDSGASGMGFKWRIGQPVVFPPYVDYFLVEEEFGGKLILTRDEFYKIMDKRLEEVVGFLPDLYLLAPRKAKKTLKFSKKFRAAATSEYKFKELRLCDVIEVQDEAV